MHDIGRGSDNVSDARDATVGARVQQRIELELLAAAPRSADGGAFDVLPGMKARLATVSVGAISRHSLPRGHRAGDG